ncbi:MAG: RagB/SusD family nutrient uptake outer membrane protein, partial [Paludibacteraceae bacterium]|nr:RagB/SusD family nutrient uptake outer membrane protein [Paludibacteraceae bacterium]
FACEGIRYCDLIRSTCAGFNIDNATIAYDRINDAKAKKCSRYTSYDVYEVGDINPLKAGLAPIPQKEMDGVNGRYKQNPGY